MQMSGLREQALCSFCQRVLCISIPMGILVSGHKEAASRLAIDWGSKVTPGFEGSDSFPWAPVGTKYTQLGLYS